MSPKFGDNKMLTYQERIYKNWGKALNIFISFYAVW